MKIQAAINRVIADAKSTRLLLSASSGRVLAAIERGLFVILRYIRDTASAVETLAKNIGKRFTDSAEPSDQSSLNIGKAASDQSAVSDNIESIDLSKVLSDIAGATDDLNGEAIPGDDQTIQFIKSVSNVGSVTELKSLSVNKTLSDSTLVADVIDELSLITAKSLYNAGNVSDTNTLAFNKIEGEAIASSDNGSLLSQDYVDNPYYFAEDYVGTKRTF